MTFMYAQGDILIEAVEDTAPSGEILNADVDGATVIAEGEATGHRHAIYDQVTMFRDDGLAHDIPSGLYLGHIRVDAPAARLQHEEHATITLLKGTYRARRQRELSPREAGIVAD
jgi:hypothetical protein